MRRETLQMIVLAALVAGATVSAYAPVRGNGFVSVDDGTYVLNNPAVLRGLTSAGAAWAASATHAANWHPLTWLSHMADVSLFGVHAGAHHLMSLALHVANALLLTAFLRRVTGRLPESVLVAALFALHPMHVESVAWVAERKDVLSAFFFLLTLHAYARFTARRTAWRYVSVILLFVCAAAAKPMVVTLPFVLLLLDAWPLGRLRTATLAGLVLEKAPLVLVSAVVSAVTVAVQRAGGSMELVENASFAVRVVNALFSYFGYVGKTLLPSPLALFYPYPSDTPAAVPVVAAALLFVALLFVAGTQARTRPWIAVGWLWYLGTLVPVIGLVQVGTQAMADRYTYLPHIGLFILAVWGFAGPVRRFPAAVLVTPIVATLLITMAGLTFHQARHWKDGEAILRHTLAVTTRNWTAHYSLGAHLEAVGRTAEAISEYRAALSIRPSHAFANSNLGRLLYLAGRVEDSIPFFERAVRSRPQSGALHLNRGLALETAGRLEAAARSYAEAARLDPEDPVAGQKVRELRHAIRSEQRRPEAADSPRELW